MGRETAALMKNNSTCLCVLEARGRARNGSVRRHGGATEMTFR